MLIDQYLGVYGDPSPRVPNGVVPKNDQYLRVYGDHLSPPHKIGETVEALYCNGQWYTAQIKSRVEGSPDTFEVAWSDGDPMDTIKHKSNIRRLVQAASIAQEEEEEEEEEEQQQQQQQQQQ